MDHRDDWPDGLLEGDLDSVEDMEPTARESAERIARDARNMDAVLTAMVQQMGGRLPAADLGHTTPPRRPTAWKRWTLGPLAAAAAVAALILVPGDGTEQSGGPDNSAGAPRTPSMMADMDVEAAGPFVVFPTDNPDIAVVWLLNPKESE